MKKFSRLNESRSISIDDISDVLTDCKDSGWKFKIYERYLNRDQIVADLKNSDDFVRKCKVVVLKNDKLDFNTVNIDDYKSIGFKSNLHSISSNFLDLKESYFDVFNAISHFSEHNPQISIKNDKIFIVLDDGDLDESEIEIRGQLGPMYGDLYERLSDFLRKNSIGVNVSKGGNNVSVSTSKSRLQIVRVVKSICDIEKSGLYVADDVKVFPELVKSIKDDFQKRGFYIKGQSSSYSNETNYYLEIKKI